MAETNDGVKIQVLKQIAGNKEPNKRGDSLWQIGELYVNLKFKSGPSSPSYNVPERSTAVDLVCWIYGSHENWWLIPGYVMKDIYQDPDRYLDRSDGKRAVVSIDMERQEAKYGVDFCVIDLSPYFRATIDQLIAKGLMVPPRVAPLSLEELL